METKYELSHSELIEVFRTWDKLAITDPDSFYPISDTEDCATGQAKYFSKILSEIRQSKSVSA